MLNYLIAYKCQRRPVIYLASTSRQTALQSCCLSAEVARYSQQKPLQQQSHPQQHWPLLYLHLHYLHTEQEDHCRCGVHVHLIMLPRTCH